MMISQSSPLVGIELQLQREHGAAGGCRYVVADGEMGRGPDHLLTFSPFRVFCNIIAPPSFHVGTSVCLSSVQAALTHTLPLWLLQVQVSEASRGQCFFISGAVCRAALVLIYSMQERLTLGLAHRLKNSM